MASVERGAAADRGTSRAVGATESGWPPALVGVGLLGQAILLAVGWLLPLVSEFGVAADFISELVLGSFGVVQTAAFVVAGLTALGLAVGLWNVAPRSRALRLGAILVGVYGVGMLLTALFPTDRIDSLADVRSLTVRGMIHAAAAVTSLVASIGGLLALTWALRGHRSLVRGVLGVGVILVVALAAVFVIEPGPWVGLVQRLLGTFVAAWLLLVLIALGESDTGGGTRLRR